MEAREIPAFAGNTGIERTVQLPYSRPRPRQRPRAGISWHGSGYCSREIPAFAGNTA
jgi:hypothetical protein